MILAQAAAGLRSRFAPMPTNLHIIFCIAATVIFLLIFLRNKTVSSLIWAMICDATLILQFYDDSSTALAVGICEIFLFAILIFVSIGEKNRSKKSVDGSKQDPEPPEPDDRKDIENLIKAEQNKIPGKDSDIIDRAFEDDV